MYRFISTLIVALAVGVASPALAQVNFDVLYSGGGAAGASLAAGSDDPLTTSLDAGESFAYSLTATGGGYWQATSDTSLFAALVVSPGGLRIGDFTYSLFNDGSLVLAGSQNDISMQFVHLGNFINLSNGLVFDQLTFGVSIDSGPSSTSQSILPFVGVLENNSAISFVTGVPEPSTWAMMLLGFGAIGFSMRRARKRALVPQLA